MPFLSKKAKQLVIISVGGVATWAAGCTVLGHNQFYKDFVMPAFHFLDPEKAHGISLWMVSKGLLPIQKHIEHESLRVSVLGKTFKNPVGLAAGFDKDAHTIPNIFRLGFGFVEIGSVTPLPQPGNPKPRLFRLSEDQAVINRNGFCSEGHNSVVQRLQNSRSSKTGVVGVNLGKNKESLDAAGDYAAGATRFAPLADYLVINVSSPNTPGLRALQGKRQLAEVVDAVHEALNEVNVSPRPPLLLKIAPDLDEQDKKDIAEVALRQKRGVDGIIVTNTTVSRPADLRSPAAVEAGGLSGRPLKSLALSTLQDMYRLTSGRLPLIGVGGIESGADAYQRIRSGASLVQLYSALTFAGPPLIRTINNDLARLLKEDGYNSVTEAVGVDVPVNGSK